MLDDNTAGRSGNGGERMINKFKQEKRKVNRLDLEAGLFRLEDERREAGEEAQKVWRECMEDVVDLMGDMIGVDFGELIEPFVATVSWSLRGIEEISIS